MQNPIDYYKAIDLMLKALALTGVMVGGIWAVHTYNDTKEKEFYSAFWNKKLELFIEVSDAASTMATTKSATEFASAREQYDELFYGRLSLVEGSRVKHAMEEFIGHVPREATNSLRLPRREMQQPAYRLTLALQEELGRSWRTPFGELLRVQP